MNYRNTLSLDGPPSVVGGGGVRGERGIAVQVVDGSDAIIQGETAPLVPCDGAEDLRLKCRVTVCGEGVFDPDVVAEQGLVYIVKGREVGVAVLRVSRGAEIELIRLLLHHRSSRGGYSRTGKESA